MSNLFDSLILFVGFILWGIWAWRDQAHSGATALDSGDQPPRKQQDAIQKILGYMQKYGVTIEQLANAQTAPVATTVHHKRSAGEISMRVFTYLGGIFILGGVGTYIAMFWPSMSPFMRIFVTLGFGLGLNILACFAMNEGKFERFILPLLVIATCIETGGWGVFVDEVFPHGNEFRKALMFICGVMALQEWGMFSFFKRNSLFCFALFFTYAFLANAMNLAGMRDEYIYMILGASLISVSHGMRKMPQVAVADIGFFVAGLWFNAGLYDLLGHQGNWPQAHLITGISLCCYGYGVRHAQMPRLSAFFMLIGSAAFYDGLFDFVHGTPYELLYLAVAIAMMYGHILLESGAILFTSTLAILGFIGDYTAEHFVNSVGWPIALILLGVAFFAVGTMALRIKRRHPL